MPVRKQKLDVPIDDQHPRFRSEWSDNRVVIDVSHHQACDECLAIYDFNNYTLAIGESNSLYSGILPLTKFPNIITALKFAVNKTLHGADKGDVAASISLTINHGVRIFVWLLRNGHYSLRTVTREDITQLANDLSNQGWWNLLRYDESFHNLMEAIRRDDTIARNLVGCSNTNSLTLRPSEISKLIGLPVSGNAVPRYFRSFITQILSIASTIDSANESKSGTHGRNYSEFRSTLRVLNRLALHPDENDCISFLPFPIVEAACKEKFGSFDGRTVNLSVDSAVAIFKESLRWLYDFHDAVLEILDTARLTLDEHKKKDRPNDTGLAATIHRRIAEIVFRRKLPHQLLNQDGRGYTSANVINTVFSALAALITINQGRRANEVIGHHRPYGLYFGCTTRVSDTLAERRLDIYCEKSPQDWGVQWCNRLVVDAIDFLEEIAQRYRPFQTPPLERKSDTAEARLQKLFEWRPFTTIGFSNPPIPFHWRSHSSLFFELAGVDTAMFHKSPYPFRRTFITLHIYRYDHPDLLALENHVGHLTESATETYFRDPNKREPSQRIGRLYRKIEEGNNSIRAMLTQERKAYLAEKVLDLFSGRPLGGAFPRLILALTKRLNSSLDFRTSTVGEKASKVTAILLGRGYLPSEKPNGPCMAGTARHTKRHANCFESGALRTELASPSKCQGCVHLMTTQNTLIKFEKDRDYAVKKSSDFSLPKPVRREFAKHAEVMSAIMEREESMAESNRILFERLIATWELAVKEAQNVQRSRKGTTSKAS